MITKYSDTVYALEDWMMGEYKPQHGDIYTIKGDFISSDRDGSSGFDGKYVLNIKETSFIVSQSSKRSYFTAIPNVVVDGGTPSMPPEADQQWAFLFNLMGLEQSDAPVTGDTYGYYPTSTENVYLVFFPFFHLLHREL